MQCETLGLLLSYLKAGNAWYAVVYDNYLHRDNSIHVRSTHYCHKLPVASCHTSDIRMKLIFLYGAIYSAIYIN